MDFSFHIQRKLRRVKALQVGVEVDSFKLALRFVFINISTLRFVFINISTFRQVCLTKTISLRCNLASVLPPLLSTLLLELTALSYKAYPHR